MRFSRCVTTSEDNYRDSVCEFKLLRTISSDNYRGEVKLIMMAGVANVRFAEDAEIITYTYLYIKEENWMVTSPATTFHFNAPQDSIWNIIINMQSHGMQQFFFRQQCC